MRGNRYPRHAVLIRHHETGEIETQSEWARRLGVNLSTLTRRRRRMPEGDPRILAPCSWGQPKGPALTHPETGETMQAEEWARRLGIPFDTIYGRAKKFGRDDPRVLHPTKLTARMLTHPETGETMSIEAWSKVLGIKRETLDQRLAVWPAHDPRVFMPVNAMKSKPLTDPETGDTMTQVEWAKALGVKPVTIRRRVRLWGPHDPRVFTRRYKTKRWRSE